MKMNILIVEDAKINQVIFSNILNQDFIITMVANSNEAKNYLGDLNYRFDVILLDLLTPGTIELLRAIKNTNHTNLIPVIVITASEEPKDLIQAFDVGAYDYITKPFIHEVVTKRIINAAFYYHRYRQIIDERDQLLNEKNVDELTKVFTLDSAKWLIDEKLSYSKGDPKALILFEINNLDTVYQEEGYKRGNDITQFIAEFISSQFRRTDIIGRVSDNQIIVFMNHIIDNNIAIVKSKEVSRLFEQRLISDIPENISIYYGISDNCHATSYQELYQNALQHLETKKVSSES